ncbi:MAG: hypothetical protein ACTSR5_15900 [Promethearchaeota archaeon]
MKIAPSRHEGEGRAISHAVDVCEILRNRFLKGTEYKGITLSTEQLEGEKIAGNRQQFRIRAN